MPATAVFSDIDGTLLNSASQVTPRTRRAIAAVQAAGIPFVIVTARGISGTYPLLEQQEISCTVVTYSGGVILDEARNVIHHHGLTRAQAQEVVDNRTIEKIMAAYDRTHGEFELDGTRVLWGSVDHGVMVEYDSGASARGGDARA